MTTDLINPKFVFVSPVRHDGRHAEATPDQLLEHVDHAIIALDAQAPVGGSAAIEQLSPVVDAARVRVDLWVNDLGDYTCTYGFLVTSEDGRVPYARGERSVVSAGAKPWSRDFRAVHAELMKDLPAFA